MKSGMRPLNSSLSEQFDALKAKLEKSASYFSQLPENVVRQVSCVAYGYKYIPEILFEPKQLLFFAELGFRLNIAVYDLTSVSEDS